ncbi:YihY/virulence factor BrkB family protein [Bacillus sp. SL00103]
MRWIISPLILLIVFTSLYYFAPNMRLKLKFVLPGAILHRLVGFLVSMLFSFYVGEFANYSAMYGSIGGIIILMIWFYLTGIMIILGGELNALYISVKLHQVNYKKFGHPKEERSSSN